jgi:DnaJ-class molecular chaperone
MFQQKSEDPYKILGISPDATEEQVKKAYKTMAKKHHPDKGGTVEKMKEINQAYSDILKGSDPTQEFPEFAELFKMFGGGNIGNLGNIGNILNGLGGMGQFMRGPNMRGPNIHTNICLSLEELEKGGIYKIKYTRKIPTGKMLNSISQTPFGIMQVVTPEEINKDFEQDVEIPSCFDERNTLVLFGAAKADNLPPSDLYISITVTKHSKFTRVQGTLDLQMELEITLKEALTGFSREIIMLNNTEPDIIELETIVNPYDNKRIKDYGMQLGEKIGDLVIKFKIQFPVIISENTKNSLRDLSDL